MNYSRMNPVNLNKYRAKMQPVPAKAPCGRVNALSPTAAVLAYLDVYAEAQP